MTTENHNLRGTSVEHGIQGGVYTSNGMWYVPRLFCLCGFATSKTLETWEEAGAELDEHLAEHKESDDE